MNAHDSAPPLADGSADTGEPPADGPSTTPGHLSAMRAWVGLGATLAALGLHRLAIAAPGIGGPDERARYVTHEEQLRELVAHIRRRDRRLSRAIVKVFSADARILGACGRILLFVANEGRRAARGPR